MVGEIRMFGGNFSPAGWAFCEGQLMPISENEVLFQLIGTTYGGDGEETFALPDLRGRLPIHQGNGFILGENGGVESVTLTTNQIPVHTHALLASVDAAQTNAAANQVLAQDNFVGADPYLDDNPNVNMAGQAITPVGGSQPHTNFQPYLCINFIISLFGVYPPPN
jgi:microcystin-dependent protein